MIATSVESGILEWEASVAKQFSSYFSLCPGAQIYKQMTGLFHTQPWKLKRDFEMPTNSRDIGIFSYAPGFPSFFVSSSLFTFHLPTHPHPRGNREAPMAISQSPGVPDFGVLLWCTPCKHKLLAPALFSGGGRTQGGGRELVCVCIWLMSLTLAGFFCQDMYRKQWQTLSLEIRVKSQILLGFIWNH